ncbi:NmrA family NAD(P)-binding protein [Flavobacterium filum]|uniref:SDR family oxidoreductase n=1 Tax=Flavobacterium filum TaxID=370974 RepID=UPI0023F1D21F|nr:NmrA family NAD(P)-binding protein [Flavobacterium filum]
MKVLVYGASGSQQFPVIKALLHKGAEVYATTHTETNLQKLNQAGANAVLANMSDLSRLKEITAGMDAISLLVPFFLEDPNEGFNYAKNAIDAAVANKTKLIVWNSSGFVLPDKIDNPSMDIRIDVANYLKDSGMPHIIIQPSVYAENLLGPWTVPYVTSEKKVAYPTPEEMPVGWIATQDVAAFVAEAIYKPELAGESFLVSGIENLTGNQLAEKFTIGLSQKFSYFPLPPKDFGQILDNIFGEGAGKGAEEMYQNIVDTKQYPVMFSPYMSDVLEKLPIKMTSMEDWVMQHSNVYNK